MPTTNEVLQSRGWKLFFLLPRILQVVLHVVGFASTEETLRLLRILPTPESLSWAIRARFVTEVCSSWTKTVHTSPRIFGQPNGGVCARSFWNDVRPSSSHPGQLQGHACVVSRWPEIMARAQIRSRHHRSFEFWEDDGISQAHWGSPGHKRRSSMVDRAHHRSTDGRSRQSSHSTVSARLFDERHALQAMSDLNQQRHNHHHRWRQRLRFHLQTRHVGGRSCRFV